MSEGRRPDEAESRSGRESAGSAAPAGEPGHAGGARDAAGPEADAESGPGSADELAEAERDEPGEVRASPGTFAASAADAPAERARDESTLAGNPLAEGALPRGAMPPATSAKPQASRGKGARARREPRASATSGFPWERSPLAAISSTAILAELQRRRERTAVLLAEHARIRAEMDAIVARLADLGEVVPARGSAAGSRSVRGTRASGPPASRTPGARGRNTQSLAEAIAQAVEARTIVTPAEAADRVRHNGYVTSSKTFNQSVSLTLSKHIGFRRVGRGRYERLT
jgi:hypothetical protein